MFHHTQTVSTAVICYQCNSEYDPRCGDPFDSYSLGTVNCSMKEHLEHLPGIEPTICRKTTQKSKFLYFRVILNIILVPIRIVFNKMRVVRDCGYLADIEHDNQLCLKRSGTFEVQTHFCSCTDDLCNSAEQMGKYSILSVASITFAAIAFSRLLLLKS